VFDKIFDIAKITKFSIEERAFYEASMMNKLDQYAALKCARDEGREEGEARGVAIGEARGMERGREEVFSLLESGMSLTEAKRKLGLQI
jgi:flagellar biosynthesis/type III secretory pathway protein FliH